MARTDRERLEFIATKVPYLRVGYPSVSFCNGEVCWGSTLWSFSKRTLKELRKEIDICMDKYAEHLKYAEKGSFD